MGWVWDRGPVQSFCQPRPHLFLSDWSDPAAAGSMPPDPAAGLAGRRAIQKL